MKTATLILALAVITPGVALANLTETCAANFAADGGFWKGKSFKTHLAVPGVAYADAFRRVAQAVTSNGWNNIKTDKDLGTITANMDVAYGNGATAPLNIIVKDQKGGGVDIEAVFTTQAGKSAAEKAVRDGMCKLITAAEG